MAIQKGEGQTPDKDFTFEPRLAFINRIKRYPNVDEFLTANQEVIDECDTLRFKFYDLLRSHERRHRLSSVPAIRLESTMAAAYYYTLSPVEFGDLLKPEVIESVVALTNQDLVHGGLSFQELATAQEESLTERTVNDYLAVVQIEAIVDMLGINRLGDKLIMGRFTEERDAIVPFVVELSGLTPNFTESFSRIAGVVEEKLQGVENYTALIQEIDDKLADLLAQPRSESRNQQVIEQLELFFDVRSSATGSFSRFVVDPFRYLSRAIEDSATGEFMAREAWESVWAPLRPARGYLDETWEEEDYKRRYGEVKRAREVMPRFAELARGYLQATKKDAEEVSLLVDRKPGESDDSYRARLRSLAEVHWSSIQREIIQFLNENQEDVIQHPLILLHELSRLCNCKKDLVHAQRTLHQDAISRLEADELMRSALGEVDAKVIQLTPHNQDGQVMIKRVLIEVPEASCGYEWVYPEANLKFAVDLDEESTWKDCGPMNVMTKGQYKQFCALMDAIASRQIGMTKF